MMIRSTLIAAAAAVALSGVAFADEAKGPSVMTDQELGATVAGHLYLQVYGSDGVVYSASWHARSVYSNSRYNSNPENTSGLDTGWDKVEGGFTKASEKSDHIFVLSVD